MQFYRFFRISWGCARFRGDFLATFQCRQRQPRKKRNVIRVLSLVNLFSLCHYSNLSAKNGTPLPLLWTKNKKRSWVLCSLHKDILFLPKDPRQVYQKNLSAVSAMFVWEMQPKKANWELQETPREEISLEKRVTWPQKATQPASPEGRGLSLFLSRECVYLPRVCIISIQIAYLSRSYLFSR